MSAHVVTFYSYKGGVGRTQALANIAVRLANRGKRVIIVDMDLESPGVHAFFSPFEDQSRTFQEIDFINKTGVIDFFAKCSTLPDDAPTIEGMLVPCFHRFLKSNAGSLQLLPPGRLDSAYVDRLSSFSWDRFYAEQHGYAYVELMRNQLCSLADVVLIDSRTGLTDPGMVCTFQLPDIIVVLFALHRQGVDGVERVARAVTHYRNASSSGERVRQVLLVPSRVDDRAEHERAEQFLKDARRHLGSIDNCELLDGPRDRIPYIAWFAYGENIVDPQADNDLAAAYERLTDRVEGSISPPLALEQRTKEEVPPPLFESLDRERNLLQHDIAELIHAVQVSRRDDEPLDRLTHHANDIAYRTTELSRRIIQLNEMVQHLALVEGNVRGHDLSVPRSLGEWEAFVAAVDGVLDSAKLRLFSTIRERVYEAALGDDNVVSTLWPDIQKSVMAASAPDLGARIASFEAHAKRSSLDAQLQRGALEYTTFVAKYRTAKERTTWLDERIQRVMDQEDMNMDVAGKLANLLVLRAEDRAEEPLLPYHWISYDVLCLLLDEHEEKSNDAFRRIGIHLWSDAWRASFEIGTATLFPSIGVECRKQIEQIVQQEEIVAPLLDLIVFNVEKSWRAGGTSRDRVHLLIAERRFDPCLKGALVRLAAAGDEWTALCAAWLLDVAPAPEPAFEAPFRRVLDHLAKNDRAGEAYYGLLSAGTQDPRILDDPSFFFVLAALFESLLRQDRDDVAESFLYDAGFCDRLGSTPHGISLLVIVTCAIEKRARKVGLRKAARSALTQQMPTGVPSELNTILFRKELEDISEVDTLLDREAVDSITKWIGCDSAPSWLAARIQNLLEAP